MSSSRNTRCLFKASTRQGEAGDWQVYVANGEHNHEPFDHQSAHPQRRALAWEARQEVLALTCARVTPVRIVTSLRQNHDALVIAQDVYKLRHTGKSLNIKS